MIIPNEMINWLKDNYKYDFIENSDTGLDSTKILNAAKYYDAVEENLNRVEILTEAFSDAKIWLQIKGTKVKDIYHVFNPLTGQHTSCTSMDEAKKTREKIMQEFLESHSGLFSVAQEIETPNGDTLWNPIDIDKM